MGGRPRDRITLTCEWCKAEFEITKCQIGQRKHCSTMCYALARRAAGSVTRRCEACNKLFVRPQWNKATHCSVACANISKGKKATKRCEVCGETFEVYKRRRNTARFCSLQCQGVSQRKVAKRPSAGQLRHLLVRKSLKEVGDFYGVHYGTVRYWCECHEIGWPSGAQRKWLKTIRREFKLEQIEERYDEHFPPRGTKRGSTVDREHCQQGEVLFL